MADPIANARALIESRAGCDRLAADTGLTDGPVLDALREVVEELAAIRTYLDAVNNNPAREDYPEWEAVAEADRARLQRWGDRVCDAGMEAEHEATEEAEQERDALAATLAELRADLETATRDGMAIAGERDELAATLANERGEGAPPSEGWRWEGRRDDWKWAKRAADGVLVAEVVIGSRWGTAPTFWLWSPDEGETAHEAPSARAAMIAADKARAEVPRG